MPQQSNRRKFLKTAAVAPVALTALDSSADEHPQPPPVVQSLTEIVRRRYGKHLTESQIKNIQAAIQSDLVSAETLKRARLENGDEPAFMFVPDID